MGEWMLVNAEILYKNLATEQGYHLLLLFL